MLFCFVFWYRRPRRGFQNWARRRHGTNWAVGKQRRAAAQTVMMKMDVKPQEMVKAKPVSNTCPPPPTSKYSHIHTHFIVYIRFLIVILLAKVMSPNLVQVCVTCIYKTLLFLSPTFHMLSTPLFVMIYCYILS